MSRPPKILLSVSSPNKPKKAQADTRFHPGDSILEAEIEHLDFFNAHLKILDPNGHDIKARIHCTMAQCDTYNFKKDRKSVKAKAATTGQHHHITTVHPFHPWSVGMKLKHLTVIKSATKDGVSYLELSNCSPADKKKGSDKLPLQIESNAQIPPGSKVSGIIKQIAPFNGGLWLQLSPDVAGFIPGLELSEDLAVLNNLAKYFPLGARLKDCLVINKLQWLNTKSKARHSSHILEHDKDTKVAFLSLLRCNSGDAAGNKNHKLAKPLRGDLVVGRIQRSIQPIHPPALMMELRGGFLGQCCITELEEVDEWVNMPIGKDFADGDHLGDEAVAVVSGESDEEAKGDKTRKKKDSKRYVGCQSSFFVVSMHKRNSQLLFNRLAVKNASGIIVQRTYQKIRVDGSSFIRRESQ